MIEPSASTDRDREAVKAWVESVMKLTGLSASALGTKAGLAATTIRRFLRHPVKHMLSTTTLSKIASYAGVPLPIEIAMRAPLETDPEIMQVALDEARIILANVTEAEAAKQEAALIAEIYDVLMETLRDGKSISDAVRVIRNMKRRQVRRLSAERPPSKR